MVNFGCANLNVETFSQTITDGKYKDAYDIKRRVIVPALEEINATTDITVSLEEVRDYNNRGKPKTIGYKFHIKEKTYEEKQNIIATWGIPFEDILLLGEGERPDFKDIEEEKEEEEDYPF